MQQALNFIKNHIGDIIPESGLILGSGIGFLAEQVQNPTYIPYSEIPEFPKSTVQGHAGKLVFGELEGKNVVMMQGRFHFYEGHTMQTLAIPIRILKGLGVKSLIITNASGGVNPGFKPGDVMLINDHINFSFGNPLIGTNNNELGPRFPDTQFTYTPKLQELVKIVAKANTVDLKEGVYLFNTGPCYETPAEVKMARTLGADAVGMSTVPEAIVAAHCGLPVLGLSYISNMAAGMTGQPLTHDEVMEGSELVKDKLVSLIKGVLKEL